MEKTYLLGEEKYRAAKYKRESVFAASLRGKERMKSAKRKEAEGKTFNDIIESPSAQRSDDHRDEVEEENEESSVFLAEPLAIRSKFTKKQQCTTIVH